MKLYQVFLLRLFVLSSCKENTKNAAALSEASIKRHIIALSSDSFEGRKPFTAGEEKTVAYLLDEIKKIGLKPANGDSYTQDVPLIEINGHPSETLELVGDKPLSLKLGEQYVAFTQQPVPEINIASSALVFCGYGL
jgi:hypothetical protein